MTNNQLNVLYNVNSELSEIRNKLDRTMYGGEPMDDETYKKYRQVYDAICKVQDLL